MDLLVGELARVLEGGGRDAEVGERTVLAHRRGKGERATRRALEKREGVRRERHRQHGRHELGQVDAVRAVERDAVEQRALRHPS